MAPALLQESQELGLAVIEMASSPVQESEARFLSPLEEDLVQKEQSWKLLSAQF